MEQRGAWRPSALTLDGDDEGQQCQLQGAVHLAARQRPRKTSALPESRLRCLCRTHMASDDRPAPRPAARDPGQSGSCSAGRGLWTRCPLARGGLAWGRLLLGPGLRPLPVLRGLRQTLLAGWAWEPGSLEFSHVPQPRHRPRTGRRGDKGRAALSAGMAGHGEAKVRSPCFRFRFCSRETEAQEG